MIVFAPDLKGSLYRVDGTDANSNPEQRSMSQYGSRNYIDVMSIDDVSGFSLTANWPRSTSTSAVSVARFRMPPKSLYPDTDPNARTPMATDKEG